MTPELARAIMLELRRRDPRPPFERLVDPRFPKQMAFVLDQARFVCAQCTRRAGKSNGHGYRMWRAGLKYPKALVPYFALTRDSAKRIMWPVLLEQNERYGLGARPVETELTLVLPNEARLILYGADMKNFIPRIRGIKTPYAGVDEAQSFGRHLAELLDDILTPAIADYEDGTIGLTGTPGPIPKGIFYDASHGKQGWSAHRWSLFDNPYMPYAKKFLEEYMAKKGWTDLNPTYRREWLGEWVIDLDSLVYRFIFNRNTYRQLPTGHRWQRTLAIDYGWNDATAFAVAGYSRSLRDVFIEHAEGHKEMTPSEIAGRLFQLIETYKPDRIVADTGGLGKSITEEMKRRYGIPVQAAEKTEKLTAISLMNGDFIDKHLFVHESLTDLHDQYETLIKGEDHKEDPNLPNDLCDAALYAYRNAKHYLGEVASERPAPGSAAAWEREEREILEAEEAAAVTEATTPWWAR